METPASSEPGASSAPASAPATAASATASASAAKTPAAAPSATAHPRAERAQRLLRSLKASDPATAPVLRKLRAKFIAVNMGLAALVLTIAFATVCYMEYRSDTDEIYRTLTQAVDHTVVQPQLIPNHGPLTSEPTPNGPGDRGQRNQSFDRTIGGEGEKAPADDAAETGEAPDSDFAPPEIGGPQRGDAALPVAVYYDENGTVMQFADQSTASVAGDVLITALSSLGHSEEPYGYLPECGLFYVRHAVGPGVIIAFADDAQASAWQSLAWVLAGVGLGALAVLLLLNLLFSRWALGPVQRAWTQQQQFIADASHELKTPLTVILANNAILRQRGEETIASQGQWIESTQMEAERMQALVTDMLDLARPAPTLDAADTTPRIDFSRLVEGEALTFESVAFEGGLTWKTSVNEGIAIRGDARRLQRLVAALLDNACKYTAAGGRVTVRLGTDEHGAVLTVNNTGAPIDSADLPHLFDRFYRADKARTRDAAPKRARKATEADDGDAAAAPGGYGLGLAIAQDIARVHKGTLTAASTVEEGTTFTLRLPLA